MDHSSHGMDHSSHSSMDHSTHSGMDHSAHMMMNHSDHGMDHSQHMNMDHSQHMSMDHSSMSHMDMMKMYFHCGYENEIVLFQFWKITSIQGLILSMIGIFLVAALYEGLKYFREYLFWKSYNSLQYRSVQIPVDKTPSETSSNSRVIQPTMLSMTHLVQTVLHILQITISYLLMLIFMTYNVWLCLAVVLGAATGYFLFGWKKSVVVDVTEHCH